MTEYTSFQRFSSQPISRLRNPVFKKTNHLTVTSKQNPVATKLQLLHKNKQSVVLPTIHTTSKLIHCEAQLAWKCPIITSYFSGRRWFFLVFGLLSDLISRSVRARLQVCVQ